MMSLQEEQEREIAILQQINMYQLGIYKMEADIAASKMEITKLDWQLKELRNEFQQQDYMTDTDEL
jgi:hypothetical protein